MLTKYVTSGRVYNLSVLPGRLGFRNIFISNKQCKGIYAGHTASGTQYKNNISDKSSGELSAYCG